MAYHYSRAEDWQRAQDYLLKAGQQATILSGEPEALAQYRQALDALLRAFDETWRTPSIADPVAWLVERVELFWDLRLLGELLESVQVFHRKVTDTYGLEDPRSLTAAYILAASYLQRDMYSEAGSLLERTLDELKGSEERNEMLLNRVLLLLGICRLNQDRFTEAEHLLSTALEQELSLDIPNDHLVVDASIYLSTAFYFSGRLGQDRGLIEKALAKAHDSRRPQYWELLLNLSSSQLVFGDYSQARDCARRCLEESTSPYIRSHASAHLAAVLHAQEDYAQAQHYYQLAIEGFQSLGRMGEEADAVRDLAETQLQLGEFEEAERAAREAIRLADAAYGTRGYQAALAYWTLAGVAHARKEEDVANAYLEESENIARQRIAQENPFWAELFFRRALVHSAEGKEDEAREGLRAALKVFGNIGGDRHPRWRSMESLWFSLAPHSP